MFGCNWPDAAVATQSNYPLFTCFLLLFSHLNYVQLFAILCNLMDCSPSGSFVLYYLLEFVQNHVH